MTTNELLANILQLMEINFGESYYNYEAQVYHINFDGQDYDIYKEDAKVFAELRDRLIEAEGLKLKNEYLNSPAKQWHDMLDKFNSRGK